MPTSKHRRRFFVYNELIIMSRFGKQLIYGFFYLLILALLGVWVYFAFLRPAASCTNGRQDGGEEGVDCGGVCANACLPAGLSELQVTDTNVFHPGNGITSVLAKIQNPNLRTAASFDYTLKFYDLNGEPVLTRSGSSYIYAGEVKYLTDFVSGGAADGAKSAELTISSPRWLPDSEFSKPQAVILSRTATLGEAGIQVSGKLANRDTLTLSRLEVGAVFYGRYNYAVGVSKTEIDSVLPNETRDFVIAHPPIAGVDLSRTEYFVSVPR